MLSCSNYRKENTDLKIVNEMGKRDIAVIALLLQIHR